MLASASYACTLANSIQSTRYTSTYTCARGILAHARLTEALGGAHGLAAPHTDGEHERHRDGPCGDASRVPGDVDKVLIDEGRERERDRVLEHDEVNEPCMLERAGVDPRVSERGQGAE